MSDEPLYTEDGKVVPAFDMEDQFTKLPWYSRLWYLFLSFFKSKPSLKIFEENQVAFLGNKIDEKSPGLFDYENNILLPVFYRQIQRLKDASHFFYSALDTGVNRDKGAFFAFLGSLEMPDVHNRLQEVTDPAYFTGINPGITELELRQSAFREMDDALALITGEYRNTMYINARSLYCLMGLASFLYDRLLVAFEYKSSIGGETCSAGVVKDLLISLNNTLLSLKTIPPMPLLESLFVFAMQEKAKEPGFDIGRETRALLARAESSLTVIREFNKQVPLTWILRCCTKNMSFLPVEVSGGEDWFVVYRDFWKRRFESLYSEYTKNRRQSDLLDSFRYFLKGKSLKTLANIQSGTDPGGMPIKGGFALAFLYTFYSVVFMPDINWVLRPILIDGDFVNKDNRLEFAENYNNLIKLEDEIKKFEMEISPVGDYGERYSIAKQEMSSLQIKRRKIQIVVEEAQDDARKILERAREASKSMVNILNGILGRDPKGKYGTLANLTKIGGKENHQLIAGIGDKIKLFQTVLKILDDIESMEYGR